MRVEMPLNDQFSDYVESITYDPIGDVLPETEVEWITPSLVKMKLCFVLEEQAEQDDWQLHIRPAFQPTFHWAPHLTPTDEHIIDQHSFRSPAVMVSDTKRCLTMIPDLDLLSKPQPVRWYMDNDATSNLLRLGMSEYEVKKHVLYTRAPGAVYPAGKVEIGFYLWLSEDSEVLANPWRQVLELMWERWGSPLFQTGAPLAQLLEPLVKHAYRWAFDTWAEHVWQEFDWEGERVGAAAFIVNVTQSPNYPGPYTEREFRSIWNQAWFSSMRSASGVYRYGIAVGDPELVERARLTKRLALSAPQREGLFPSVIATEMEELEIEGKKVTRSKGWDTAFWGNSDRNPWGTVKGSPYHILDMSWTALLMLRWYEELEKDESLIAYASRYADKLIELQDDKGYFPAWLDYETLEPIEILRQSPETAMSVTFLLKMAKLTGDRRYARSALRAADIVAEEVMPEGRWEDFETYWSCSSFGAEDHVGRKYERNNMYKQCNFSMFWCAEAFMQSYRATDDRKYLQWGERCLDELLMTQASWQPPYIYVQALGGFGVLNGDGEWNDARQSLFAELIIDYGMELDRKEYVERGLAAIRCAFVMMYCPEIPDTKVQWEKAHPFFDERDYGFMMENYGHGGRVNSQGRGMGTFTIFDWGNGAAAESYMKLKAHYPEVLTQYGL
jgi:hypothetical protein